MYVFQEHCHILQTYDNINNNRLGCSASCPLKLISENLLKHTQVCCSVNALQFGFVLSTFLDKTPFKCWIRCMHVCRVKLLREYSIDR